MRHEPITPIAEQAPEIEALLSISHSMSIFDRLMAMPRADETSTLAQWDRAVSARLATRVSSIIRERVGPGDSAHAA